MKKIWIPLLAIVALVAGAALFMGGREPQWTTDSPEALAEFELCQEAQMRFYYRDAEENCRRALALDPTFVAARLATLRFARGEERKRMVEELRDVDLSRLTPTESFLLRHRLARADEQWDEATAILAARLEEDPYDVFAVSTQCDRAWGEQDFDGAESCYLRLLEIDPNWAMARNHLGYIAMARGDFDEAEEQFESYRFIAPDQANPHDSMGELLTLIGRYEEAVRELEAALEIRPDFCASYRHLVSAHLLANQFDAARSVVADFGRQPDCGDKEAGRLNCSVEAWEEFARGNWEGVLEATSTESCVGAHGDAQIFVHEALARLGRSEEAKVIEQQFRDLLAGDEVYGKERETIEALSYHMWGVRLAAEGDFEAAASRLGQADQTLVYWNDSGLGIFKLYNQVARVRALQSAGRSAEAAALTERIRQVNPRLAAEWLD